MMEKQEEKVQVYKNNWVRGKAVLGEKKQVRVPVVGANG